MVDIANSGSYTSPRRASAPRMGLVSWRRIMADELNPEAPPVVAAQRRNLSQRCPRPPDQCPPGPARGRPATPSIAELRERVAKAVETVREAAAEGRKGRQEDGEAKKAVKAVKKAAAEGREGRQEGARKKAVKAVKKAAPKARKAVKKAAKPAKKAVKALKKAVKKPVKKAAEEDSQAGDKGQEARKKAALEEGARSRAALLLYLLTGVRCRAAAAACAAASPSRMAAWYTKLAVITADWTRSSGTR
ncbi:MAG: hypothetical protein MZV70_07805 [Desulfobacterales bacterium]|nr:hypothetical protein [Desulfobacterales bacterium]